LEDEQKQEGSESFQEATKIEKGRKIRPIFKNANDFAYDNVDYSEDFE
jgi:hypothetical protein